MEVDFSGKFKLSSPIIIGAGILGAIGEKEESPLINLIPWEDVGAITTKSITFNPKEGNVGLRVLEVPSGVINAIGLENPGVIKFVDYVFPLISALGKPIIISCAGEEPEEFVKIISYIKKAKLNNIAFELNLSCPNVRKGGLEYGINPMLTYEVISSVREVTDLPIIAKLTPAVTDITEIAKYAIEAGVDLLCIANTYPVLGIYRDEFIFGGLSGAPLKYINLALVNKVYSKFDIPIIGSGGILSEEDAIDYILAGAKGISLGVGLYINPKLPKRINEFLKKINA